MVWVDSEMLQIWVSRSRAGILDYEVDAVFMTGGLNGGALAASEWRNDVSELTGRDWGQPLSLEAMGFAGGT